MGLFENKRNIDTESRAGVFACDEHLETNLKLTRESMVLLKNKNNILPLGNNIKRLAVFGPNADDLQAQFGDWTFFSHPVPNHEAIPNIPCYTMLKGIKEACEKKNIEIAYHKGCDVMDSSHQDILGAVNTAKDADVIIVVIGDHLDQNGEDKDRANLDLSGAQLELLVSLKELGKPVIAVLVNGKPLSIPWVFENCDAIVETFNSGMFGGKILAELLFGEFNPSGKLSISFPHHTGQLPGWHWKGKYMDMPMEPLCSFGYGLSYTTFEYSNLRLSKNICTKDESIVVYIDVTNTGKLDGKETVQISLNISDLAIVKQDESYVVEPGEFEIMAGGDSRDSSLLKTVLTVK
jgi:beta-glucosidase